MEDNIVISLDVDGNGFKCRQCDSHLFEYDETTR